MERSLKKWWCDPCHPFFTTSYALFIKNKVIIKSWKIKAISFPCIHLYGKKKEVFLNKQYNNLQTQSLFYAIQGGQEKNTLEFST